MSTGAHGGSAICEIGEAIQGFIRTYPTLVAKSFTRLDAIPRDACIGTVGKALIDRYAEGEDGSRTRLRGFAGRFDSYESKS